MLGLDDERGESWSLPSCNEFRLQVTLVDVADWTGEAIPAVARRLSAFGLLFVCRRGTPCRAGEDLVLLEPQQPTRIEQVRSSFHLPRLDRPQSQCRCRHPHALQSFP